MEVRVIFVNNKEDLEKSVHDSNEPKIIKVRRLSDRLFGIKYNGDEEWSFYRLVEESKREIK